MSTKPFLILQLRPEDEAADNEFDAFLHFGRLEEREVRRVRMERDGIPEVRLDQCAGVIVGGGPYNVSDRPEKKGATQKDVESKLQALLKRIIATDTPYLGACYGLGALTASLGGTVSKERYGEEVGAVTVTQTKEGERDPLLSGLPKSFRAFVGHKEACQSVPPGAVLLASSLTCPVQMIRVGANVYATQFHPELDSEGLALRIKVYKHAGYFKPEDADTLIAKANREQVEVPMRILERFVERYR